MRKLYRSRTDSKLFGLCGGLAEYLNVDPTLLRVILVITAVFSGGTVIALYLIASLIIPKEPLLGGPTDFNSYTTHTNPDSGYGTYGSYYTGGANPGRPPEQPPAPSAASGIDELMKDVEKKALLKEIEELKSKLAKFEKEDK